MEFGWDFDIPQEILRGIFQFIILKGRKRSVQAIRKHVFGAPPHPASVLSAKSKHAPKMLMQYLNRAIYAPFCILSMSFPLQTHELRS